MTDPSEEFPFQVQVRELVTSRYSGVADVSRPASWDRRVEGVDLVCTSDGRTLKLWSDGGQSPPKKNWNLVITGGDREAGYRWTLHGIAPQAH